MASVWSQAESSGRIYYYNTVTKATQWTKPEELMTPSERALANQPWKQHTSPEGRPYWYHGETKQTTWEMPEVYKNALAQSAQPPKPQMPAPQFVAGGANSFSSQPQQRDRDDYGERIGQDRQIGYGQMDINGARGVTFDTQVDPNYATFEEGEAAFISLLRRQKVQPDWTWEQTMRATIKDPQYRALKDPKDRKAAFEKYAVEVRLQEKDRAKERLAKLRTDFGTMLRRHPEIKHYTRWKTARPIIEGETIFRSTNDDTERKQLFEEYIIELKKAHIEQEAMARKSAMDELVQILKGLDLEPYTRWAEADSMIRSDNKFQEDSKFLTLSKSDILTAFENHIKSLERTFNDERQREKNSKARRERQNRDRFLDLLSELRAAGKIKAGTKWMSIYPDIKDDARYTNMLGQRGSGSTPLDLFWDVVEEEERTIRIVRNDVYDVLEDKRYEVTPKTTFQEFLALMSTDRRTTSISEDTLSLIFARLQEKVVRKSEHDQHANERHQRRNIDALRSKIKHLSNPPITASSTWETIRPQIAHMEEFKALESDDLRRQAFEKVIRRLREKEDDHADRERSSHGKRDRRNGHYDPRDHGREARHRTPELDIYEAERRKAMADRERVYSTKAGATGLSPPPIPVPRSRERDRHERLGSRGEGRSERDRRGHRYPSDLEHTPRSARGEEDVGRERERDRLYATRPARGERELDYGDSRAGGAGGRRRRGSEGSEEGGVRKRRRGETPREKRVEKTRTPEVVKEEVGLRSGSEEGEMVEDD
ncbi:MAG: hypothetical protein L6R42_000748 [Xanthoria sp. 1 TBL-2021]|nr:MAG: hypothetical protein L6R42_000748 [Xanthoria sp. 1 TBL-2021]